MSPTVLSQRIAEDGARRALAVPEILDYILQRLEPRALYHAALVCQFWKDVALNLLWSTAIVPFQAWMSLLSPMSPFRVEDGTCLTFASQPPTIIALKRPRFFEYSSKIKKLVISNGLVPKSMAFVQMLTKRAGRTSLVPRLAHVIVQSEGRNVSPSSIIDSTAALSGKSTTTLKIDGTFPHKSIPQLFQSMVKGGAKIRDVQTEIELRGRYSLEVITFDLLPELRRCKCNAVTLAEGWPSLARCPRLRTLQVDTIRSYDESAENPMLEFKSLREVCLPGPGVETVLLSSSFPSLRKFSSRESYDTTADILHTITTRLVKQSPHIEAFHFHLMTNKFDALKPILSIANLRRLHLQKDYSDRLPFGDADVTLITRSLRKLEELVLNFSDVGETEGDQMSYITPGALLEIARNCPFLSLLSIALNAREFSRTPMPPKLVHLQTIKLNVNTDHLPNIPFFVDFLVHLCPSNATLAIQAPIQEVWTGREEDAFQRLRSTADKYVLEFFHYLVRREEVGTP